MENRLACTVMTKVSAMGRLAQGRDDLERAFCIFGGAGSATHGGASVARRSVSSRAHRPIALASQNQNRTTTTFR